MHIGGHTDGSFEPERPAGTALAGDEGQRHRRQGDQLRDDGHELHPADQVGSDWTRVAHDRVYARAQYIAQMDLFG
jgi:hypothetical protein